MEGEQDGREPRGPRVPGELVILGRLFLAGLAVFPLARTAILLAYSDRFAGVDAGTIASAFTVGARVDSSFLALMLVPVWLLCFLPFWNWTTSRVARGVIASWVGLCSFVVVFGSIADVVHYGEVDARLDAGIVDDLLQFGILFDYLLKDPTVAVLLVAVVAVAVFGARKFAGVAKRWSEHAAKGRMRVVVALAILGGMYFAGRLPGSANMWWGAAYFSQDYVANQLAVNGVYNLTLAVASDLGDDTAMDARLAAMPTDEAIVVMREQLSSPRVEWADDPTSPLWRRTDTGAPPRDLNVVLVLMESFEARRIESLGGQTGLTPCFDELAAGGVLFTRQFAVGTRSNRALSGVFASLPGLPGMSVLRNARLQHGLFTVARALEPRGYTSVVAQACSAHFDNLRWFALSNGFDTVWGREDYVDPLFHTSWGVSDEDVFREALDRFGELAEQDAPFFGTVMTQSNHRPYTFPEGRVERVPGKSQRALINSAVKYADWALGDFMDKARKEPWFDETVFVFVADHGKDRAPVGGPDLESFRIPLLLYAPKLLPPRRIDDACSQLDVAPTILGLIGGTHEHCLLGRDLLAPEPPRRAAMVLGDYLLWHEDDLLLACAPGGSRKLYRFEDKIPTELPDADAYRARADEFERKLMALARVGFSLPRDGRYRRPRAEGDSSSNR
jgi:phosphoglycerol transferase MdoB-like AlkP superfamily enzyme